MRIESAHDTRVSDYRVVKDGALLRRGGLFVVEGRNNLVRLIRESSHRPRSIFLSDPAALALADSLAEVDSAVPVFVAHRDVLSEIAGFDIHRGCLALCERRAEVTPDALLDPGSGPSLLVVLEDLSDPDNVGAVFRNALAFGAAAVLLSPNCCDPLYRKAIRVSMGAALCVPTARFPTWPGGLAVVRAAGYRIVALDPSADSERLRPESPLPERLALLFGAEGRGLSEESRAMADMQLRIDMAPGFDSVNVATASGIALHDVFRAQSQRA